MATLPSLSRFDTWLDPADMTVDPMFCYDPGATSLEPIELVQRTYCAPDRFESRSPRSVIVDGVEYLLAGGVGRAPRWQRTMQAGCGDAVDVVLRDNADAAAVFAVDQEERAESLFPDFRAEAVEPEPAEGDGAEADGDVEGGDVEGAEIDDDDVAEFDSVEWWHRDAVEGAADVRAEDGGEVEADGERRRSRGRCAAAGGAAGWWWWFAVMVGWGGGSWQRPSRRYARCARFALGVSGGGRRGRVRTALAGAGSGPS